MVRKVARIPKWEAELWSYISNGDGMHCPLYSHCHIRRSGKWCPDDSREDLNAFLEYGQRSLSDLASIKSGRCVGILKLVERLALKYLKRGMVHSPPVPSKLHSLADDLLPIEVRQVPLKVHHGATWRLQDAWVIQIKSDDPPDMKRFTLFHETFHIIAHHKATPVFKGRRGIKKAPFNELLANYFAACVLMPTAWVKEKWYEIQDINQMAEIFDVPQTAMGIRLKGLGLI